MEQINIGQTLSGTWDAGTISIHREGRYAKYFTFSLSENTPVVISLKSDSDIDTFLILYSDAETKGQVIDQNDDANNFSSSEIVHELSPGSYTIEATTYDPRQVGSFKISLATSGDSHPLPITIGETLLRGWDYETLSICRPGSYAKYFTFSLSENTPVIISLKSNIDTFLALFNGSDTTGTLIASNDDGKDSYNSELELTLLSGNYIIEATTLAPGKTGLFEISLSQA